MKLATLCLLLALAGAPAAADSIGSTPSIPPVEESCGVSVDGAWGVQLDDKFPRRAQSIVYDSKRDRFVQFAGAIRKNRGNPANATDLIFNDEVWIRPVALTAPWVRLVTAGPTPASRGFHGAVYDPVGDRMIMYAGLHTIRGLSDLWELDFKSEPPTWRALSAGGVQPSARYGAEVLYDAPRRRMLVCGGVAGNWASGQWGVTNEFWALHLDGEPAWERIYPTGAPLGRRLWHAGTYDSKRDRWIIAGGALSGFSEYTYPLDVLGIDLGTMHIERIGNLPQAPYSLTEFSIDYDPAADRLLLFGGAEAFSGGVQELSLAAPAAWRRLESANATAETRVEHSTYFDQVRHRLVIFGGGHFSNPLPTASLLSFGREIASATAPGQGPVNPRSHRPVTIVIAGTPDLPAAEIDGSSLRVGDAAPQGDPVLRDVDGDGLPDLVVTVVAREIGGDPAATAVPLAARTVLGEPVCGTVNIPRSGGGETVTLTASVGRPEVRLASSMPGGLTIELRDVRGAIVARTKVESPGDGWVDPAGGKRLPAGVYWARVVERAEVPAVKLLILR